MHLALQFLGPFQATLDGDVALESRAKKIEALLAFLAVEAGVAHRRERLVGLFFPEMPDEQARSNLRQTLARLRRAIQDAGADPPFLIVSREATQFNTGSDHSLDVRRFTDLLAGCPDHNPERDGSCAACMAQAAQAVALYRGPFLDGFFVDESTAFDEWLLAQRQRLQDEALAALQELADYHEARGAYDLAAASARRTLHIEPWREEGHRQLMRLLAYQGRRDAALQQYRVLEQTLEQELGVTPMPETRALRDRITAVPPTRPYDLPPANPLFVGREEESARLHAHLVHPQRRLITILGSGGSGKTALALETAWQVATRHLGPFPDGVYFVPLAGVTISSAAKGDGQFAPLVTAVAQAVGCSFAGSDNPRRQLLHFLQDKSLLLLLDNFEHLLLRGRDFLRVLLQEAPLLHILVTSRERLALRDEWIIDLAGLPYPPPGFLPAGEEIDSCPALQLFERQSRRLLPGFDLARDQTVGAPCALSDAARIVQLLQGLPLGIELAAGWVRTLTCAEIAAQIEHNLDFLKSQAADADPRHQSLRAVFDYSWALLEAEEQEALRRLSVFHGAFDLRAATAVTGVTLSTLGALVDRSWLRRQNVAGAHGAAPQFEFQEVLRQFAAEKLAMDSPEAAETLARHARYFMDVLAGQGADLEGGRQLEALATISRDLREIRAAWRWAAREREIAQLARGLAPLGLFYYMRSWFDEGAELFRLAAGCLEDSRTDPDTNIIWAQIATRCGWFLFLLGEQQAGQALLVKSAAILRDDGPASAFANALNFSAAALSLVGDYEAAQALALEALDLTREISDSYGHVIAQNILSQIAFQVGDYETARHYCEGSLRLEQAIQNRWSMGFSLANLGRVAFAQEAYPDARRHFEQSLAIRRSMADERGQAICLRYLGNTAAMLKDYDQARLDYEASLLIFRRIGSQDDIAGTLNSVGWLASVRQDLPVARQAFLAALETAHAVTAVPRVLEALAGLAVLEAARDPQRAASLAQLVLAHPAANFASRENAQSLLVQLELATNDLPVVEGQTTGDLDQVVTNLIWERQVA